MGIEETFWCNEVFWCTWPSFWIQWWSPFLWSRHIVFWTRFRVPSWATDDSNCSSTFTICQNSGLFSGCKAQHSSIKALMAGGQSPWIGGLIFWKVPKTSAFRIKYIPNSQFMKKHQERGVLLGGTVEVWGHMGCYHINVFSHAEIKVIYATIQMYESWDNWLYHDSTRSQEFQKYICE